MTQLLKRPRVDVPVRKNATMTERRRDAVWRLRNGLQGFLTTSPALAPAWWIAQRVAPLERAANRYLINSAMKALPMRPYRLTTKSDFTSWDALTDKTYNSRQLDPAPEAPTTPEVSEVVELFRRSELIECEKSTVLFAYVAQWFTDGFLRSDRSKSDNELPRDITRNESTHEVDLAQLYGYTPDVTDALRAKRDRALLAHQVIDGEEYPPDLYLADGSRVADFDFEAMRVVGLNHAPRKTDLLAMGSDTANSQIGYAMLNTLFLREHNRIARAIAQSEPSWDEDRVFAAARSVLTVVLIKLVIEEYINHITPYYFRFRFDPYGFHKQPWMRPNWTAVEFNLLYRWHGLIPSTLLVGDGVMALEQTMLQSKSLLTGHGLGALFDSASRQRAGRVGLFNTGEWLLERAEKPSITAGRTVRLRTYNEYLTACQFPRVTRFDEISSDPRIARGLEETYGSVDKVELYVGLFAEDTRKHSVLPPLMGRLVGVHAFSQLMTNPLLSPEIYKESTFSALGMKMIDDTTSLQQVLDRNVPQGSGQHVVALTRRDWKRS